MNDVNFAKHEVHVWTNSLYTALNNNISVCADECRDEPGVVCRKEHCATRDYVKAYCMKTCNLCDLYVPVSFASLQLLYCIVNDLN